jgi:hypothetical protein
LGARRGSAAEELIPETDDVTLEGVEEALTQEAPAASTSVEETEAAGEPAAEGEVAT